MKSIRTMTRTLTAALLIAAMAVPAAAATKDVGLAKAKEAALKHAGVSESQTLFLVVEADVEDGRKEYEVEFIVGEKEYDYTIDAASGRVLRFDSDLEWYSSEDDAGYGWKEVIGKQKAIEIALKHAGVSSKETQYLIAKPTWEDGERVYEVEFLADGIEYDYEIHAGSGKILDWDNERADDRYGDLDEWFTGAGGKDQWNEDDWFTGAGGKDQWNEDNWFTGAGGKDQWNEDDWFTGAGGKDQWDEDKDDDDHDDDDKDDDDSVSHGKDIGGGQAKRIALNHAGVKKADALRLRADREDGRKVYLVEFIANGREYEYEILAADGTVLEHDSDEADWDDKDDKKDKNDKFDRDDDDDDDDDDRDDD